MEDILKGFKQYLQDIGYSKSTQRSIYYCTEEFICFANKSISIMDRQDINNYYGYIRQRPSKRDKGALSESFINHNMYAVQVWFNWLEATGHIRENPASNISFKRSRPDTREPLTQEDIQQLFEAAGNIKERAILHLFYSCGLRRAEAVSLNAQDIHFNKNLLYVRRGKGAKRRAIPINESVREDFESYLLQRKNPKSIEAFMINQRGNSMSGNSYNALLQKIVANGQLPTENCTLHHLRHSIATHLLENGMGIEFVRDFLGHKYLEATQVYVKVSVAQVSRL